MQQQSALAILVDERKVNDLLKSKSGAIAFIKSLLNLVLFICFVILFSVLALQGEPRTRQRNLEAYIHRRFHTQAGMRLHDVHSIETFYEYIDRSIIPGIYGNNTAIYTFPGATVAKLLQIDGDTLSSSANRSANNRLLGVMRMRMLKVMPNMDCSVNSQFEEHFQSCYGPFSEDAEDTDDFGPTADHGGKEFVYTAPTDSYWDGHLASYPHGGFTIAFTSNYTKAMATLQLLKQANFIDRATRAVWFEFTFYNFNTALYAPTMIAFEVSPSGHWLYTLKVDVLDQRHLTPLGDGSSGPWALLIFDAILVCFVVRYLLEEAFEFLGCDTSHHEHPRNRFLDCIMRLRIKKEYFTDGWNLIDWSNLILMIVVMAYRISSWGAGGDVQIFLGDPKEQSVLTYTDLTPIVENVRKIRGLIAFNAVLTWFKAVKYINIIPYVTTFMAAVNISWRMLLAFTIIFITSFIGFCLAYSTAFGEQLSTFRTPFRAFVFLMRSFVGNAEMKIVYDAAPFLGSILILQFILGIVFVTMNLFNSIMIAALSEARQTQAVKQSKEWKKNVDKTVGFWNTVKRVLNLEARFRACMPGLYSRLLTRKKKREQLEQMRDERLQWKARSRAPQEDVHATLGAASPSHGRRKKRVFAAVTAGDDGSDDGSEPDLGPLYTKEQLRRTGGWDLDATGMTGMPMLEDSRASPLGTQASPLGEESDPEAVDLVLDAAGHIVHGLKERCRGARDLVLGEMKDTQEVLQGIGSVMEVLGRRARSLEAQQSTLLRSRRASAGR